MLSHVWLFATPWTVAPQAPLPMWFSRQEYWNGLPFPSLGDIPNPSIKPRSSALQADSLPSEPQGENWVLKNGCLQIMVLETTLESPLDSKEIKPVNPKRNPPWIVIGRTDAETEGPILWPPDQRAYSLEKTTLLAKTETGGERGGRGWNG